MSKFTRRKIFSLLAGVAGLFSFSGLKKASAEDWKWGWDRENAHSDARSNEAPAIIGGGVESGTKQLFKQNFAPSGWTFVAEDNDRALINTSTQNEGGQTGGDWQLPDVKDHALTISEIPPHTHTYLMITWIERVRAGNENDRCGRLKVRNTSSVGGGEGHSHSQVDNWRPSYVKIITCEKD